MSRLFPLVTALGLAATAPAWADTTLTFQQGANGYAGTQDTELWGGSPNTPLGLTEQSFSVDGDNGGSVSQGLLRFDNIFGNGAGQISATAHVVSATVKLTITSEGSGFTVYDMLSDWNQSSATWNSLGNGVQPNGIEAASVAIAQFGQNDGDKHVFYPDLTIDVTASLQRIQSLQIPGHGWAFIPFPNGTNGIDFSSSEAIGISNRPLLTVQVAAVPEPQTYALLLAGLAAVGATARRRMAALSDSSRL